MKKYITAVAQETNASGEQEAAYTGILQVNVVSQENNFPVRMQRFPLPTKEILKVPWNSLPPILPARRNRSV